MAFALAGLCLALPLSAQVTAPPTLGPAPALTLPKVERDSLDNGLQVMVSRNAEVPLVSAQLFIAGGARLTGSPHGMASFVGDMLDEGANGRTTFQLADELDFLGARLSTGAGWENFSVSLSGPKRTFDKAMDFMADVVLRPTFAPADIKRVRDLRLTALLTARDNPSAVAQRVFFRNVFPEGHPFHDEITGDSTTLLAFDSAAVRNFWNRAANPERATLIVTGDVTLKEAVAMAKAHFGAWKAPKQPMTMVAAAKVPPAPRTQTRIILVDKPDAAQSVIYVGGPGIPRSAPDYPATELMMTILGGSFSSRLNDILREQRGYSYGAFAGFNWSPVIGPFIASSAVRTDVTDSSLAIFIREFETIRTQPVTATELQRAKSYMVLGSLGDFETPSQVAGALSTSLLFGRPLATIAAEMKAINGLDAGDVQRAARAHLDPALLTIVIVGDIARIRPGIERLKIGPVSVQTY
jgi:predicted Zn-dependent peptidase